MTPEAMSLWGTDTYWFDVAVGSSLLALGNILFGRFEEHKPAWRRVLKAILGVAILVGVAAGLGRVWVLGLIALIAAGAVVVHGWWLPRHGVNGWTAEPRERYYELIGLDATGRRRKDRAAPDG
jgi:hypothetical protein